MNNQEARHVPRNSREHAPPGTSSLLVYTFNKGALKVKEVTQTWSPPESVRNQVPHE